MVVIGIDEAAFVAIPEPTALWHARLGTLFGGLSAAEPAVVGLALPLPVYLGALWALGTFGADERALLRRVLGRA